MPLAFARSVLTGGNSKSFTLTRSAASVNEGSSVTFTLNSSGMSGESVPYTITGISSADLSSGSLSGNIAINSDETGSASVTLANDLTTEGTETMTFTVGSDFQQFADENGFSSSVTVNDTSQAPSVTSVARSASSVNEGSAVNITVNLSNMPSGGRVYYKITGIQSADISSVARPSGWGSLTFSGASMTTEAGYMTRHSSSQATRATITLAADQLTEGAQTFTFTVTKLTNSSGTTLKTDGSSSTTVTINDTSITHPTGSILFSPRGNSHGSSSYYWSQSNANPANYGSYSNTNGGTQAFNWTVPSGVTDVAVVVVSGGSSGAPENQGAYSGGGGGGGGLAARAFRGFSPGTTYAIQVGQGGWYTDDGTNAGANPKQGGMSTFKHSQNYNQDYVYANNPSRLGNAQQSSSQSNSYSQRAGGNGQIGNSLSSGVTQASDLTYQMHTGAGGPGGRGYYKSSSNVAGGGGGGAGGWGRVNYGQTYLGTGGTGGRASTGGNSSTYGGGGSGSSANYGTRAGGVGLDGPASGGGAGGNANDVYNQAGNDGGDGSPWQGWDNYGAGGGGGGTRSGTNGPPKVGNGGGVRIKWGAGAGWE